MLPVPAHPAVPQCGSVSVSARCRKQPKPWVSIVPLRFILISKVFGRRIFDGRNCTWQRCNDGKRDVFLAGTQRHPRQRHMSAPIPLPSHQSATYATLLSQHVMCLPRCDQHCAECFVSQTEYLSSLSTFVRSLRDLMALHGCFRL